MNIKTIQLLVSVASLAFVSAGNAQQINGGLTVEPVVVGSSWTSSTLTLDAVNYVFSTSGDFASTVPTFGVLTADASTISSLSTSPTAENISDFFVFSGSGGGFGALGTSPNNRFDFNLSTLTDVGAGVFTGTGTVVDTASIGAFAPTPASFTLGFSGANNYSFSFDTTPTAVPEPTTISLLVTGLVGALAIRRRKV